MNDKPHSGADVLITFIKENSNSLDSGLDYFEVLDYLSTSKVDKNKITELFKSRNDEYFKNLETKTKSFENTKSNN